MPWRLALLVAVLALGTACAAVPAIAAPPARAPDTILNGRVTRADHQRYRRIPFIVPHGTVRIVLQFDHDRRVERTIIDLAVEDQFGLRGASGGNKAEVSIGEGDATPSYLPGRIAPGQWRLLLAIPNIRQGVTARWTARLWFLKAGEGATLPQPAAGRGPGWYRGDLHLHTGHSDGSCASQSGVRVPCPLFVTLQQSVARGLDFVALTDHNSISANAAIRESAPYFDRLLIMPGREITTFYGHFNALGVSEALDYAITPGGPVKFADIVRRIHALGGLVSINHPAFPSGEACMGCGWAMPDAETVAIDAVEVVNGGAARLQRGVEGPLSGVPFWLSALAKGQAVTAVGGSDNHDATEVEAAPGTIGRPTTVVYATELTTTAIVSGIRSGRVFIDLDGTAGSMLDVGVTAGGPAVMMGGRLQAAAAAPLVAQLNVVAPPASQIELWDGPTRIASVAVDGRIAYSVPIPRRAPTMWIRATVRTTDGKLVLLSNAVTVTD